MSSRIIGIDFDGTCVTHEFPRIGKDIGAAPVLKKLINAGHRIILFTMRSNIENPVSSDGEIISEGGNYLTDAVNWFKKNDILLWGVNKNPGQVTWTTSPKPYCHVYIDDSALGCPLKYNRYKSDHPYVDWFAVDRYFKDRYYY